MHRDHVQLLNSQVFKRVTRDKRGNMIKRLLILDDDPGVLDALKHDSGENDDLELFTAKDVQSALACLNAERPHVALIDMSLPGGSGIEMLRELKEIDPRLCVIMMSGNLNTRNAIEAMKYGAYDYLTKPLDPAQLKSVIKKAFQTSFLAREVRVVNRPVSAQTDEDGTDVMIGSSAEMLEIWKMVGKISASDATVLIQGESGTGKELLARSIFSNSSRNKGPFLAINCAAIPETLLESELFGHEKGAFTDAVVRHIGRFEQCAGGTIFLDEISEMSLKNQAKLLRVLENQEFERVGGNETIKADVRIIAATNRSLINAVKDKLFRMDLFYRLRVVTIFLPALRDRSDDIPLLVDYFIKKAAQKNQGRMIEVPPAAMKVLRSFPWKGNVRELKNVLNSAIVFSRGDTLFPEDFESLLYGKNSSEDAPASFSTGDSHAFFKPLFEALSRDNEGAVYNSFIAEAEKALIRLTMEKEKNNEVHAARFLGISRNTLRQRLLSHKLK